MPMDKFVEVMGDDLITAFGNDLDEAMMEDMADMPLVLPTDDLMSDMPIVEDGLRIEGTKIHENYLRMGGVLAIAFGIVIEGLVYLF